MELFYNDDENRFNLSIARSLRMKCLGAQWMVALYEHLTDNPYINVNGFQHAGNFTASELLNA